MVVLTFQIFILFIAVKYGTLSVHDGNNLRDTVQEVKRISSDEIPTISEGIANITGIP